MDKKQVARVLVELAEASRTYPDTQEVTLSARVGGDELNRVYGIELDSLTICKDSAKSLFVLPSTTKAANEMATLFWHKHGSLDKYYEQLEECQQENLIVCGKSSISDAEKARDARDHEWVQIDDPTSIHLISTPDGELPKKAKLVEIRSPSKKPGILGRLLRGGSKDAGVYPDRVLQ